MTRLRTAVSLAIPVLLSTTLFGQVTKDGADERMDKAIGIFRMTAATETKLIRWFEVDQDNPVAVGLQEDLCGNRAFVQTTIDDITQLATQLKKEKSLRADPDLSEKMAEVLSFERQVISKKRQLDAMGLVCAEGPESSNSTIVKPDVAKLNDLGQEKPVSVSPDFRVAARRALNALRDLEDYYQSHSSQDDNSEHAKTAGAALQEAAVQTSPRSADSNLPDTYVRALLSSYLDELNLIDAAKMGKRAYELLHKNVLAMDRESNPQRIAACKSEIPDALDASILPNEWANRKATSQCLANP